MDNFTEHAVNVLVREMNNSTDAVFSMMKFSRVPNVGELICLMDDRTLEVTKVVHTTDMMVKLLPNYDVCKMPVVCHNAYIETVENSFKFSEVKFS